jgi:hypothetical protein
VQLNGKVLRVYTTKSIKWELMYSAAHSYRGTRRSRVVNFSTRLLYPRERTPIHSDRSHFKLSTNSGLFMPSLLSPTDYTMQRPCQADRFSSSQEITSTIWQPKHITAFTRTSSHRPSPPSVKWIQSTPFQPTYDPLQYYTPIYASDIQVTLYFRFSNENTVRISRTSHSLYMPRPSHLS